MEVKGIIDELISRNISVKVREDELKLIGAREDITPALIAGIRGNKAALLEYFRASSSSQYSPAEIPNLAKADAYQVSAAQRRMWVISQLEEANIAYNMPGAYTFDGYLDEVALEECFNILVRRHESLRTVFRINGQGELLQHILSPEASGFRLEKRDLRGAPSGMERLRELAQAGYVRPFNLAEGPLLTATLYRVTGAKWVLVYVMHHIISDGWSLGVLIKELLILYKMRTEGLSGSLPELRIQYKDYVGWLSRRSEGDAMSRHREYWLKQLGGNLPVLDLIGDKARPATKSYSGGIRTRIIGRDVKTTYQRLLQQEGATLFMGLLAAVNVLLGKYTDQDEIVVGSPVAGREHPDLEGQIGLYVNTLPFRVRSDRSRGFRALLREVRQLTLDAYEHQAYPFNELVDDLGVQREMGRHPLFDVMIVLQNTENDKKQMASDAGPFTVGQYGDAGHVVSKFDLLFAFVEIGDQLQMGVEYSADLFEPATADRIAEHFETLLRRIVENEDAPIGQLSYLDEGETELVLSGFNECPVNFSTDTTILDVIERRVNLAPESSCVELEGEEWTYGRVWHTAGLLSLYLRESCGVRSGDLIGIRLERGPRLIVAMLAVMRAGGAFLPLDPVYPEERIGFMIENSECDLVFDGPAWDRFDRAEALPGSGDVGPGPGLNDLAYVLFTSGSTGTPRAVMIEHGALANSILAQQQIMNIGPEERNLQFCSSSFDASLFEIFITLIAGATLYIAPDSVKTDPVLLQQMVSANRITMVTVPPSWLKQLDAAAMPSVKKWVTGGDRITAATVAAFSAGGTYYNAYGPTEACITATIFVVQGESQPVSGLLPIGRPIPGVRTYVLDSEGMPCARGVVGELYIGGAGVARGYLNNPAETSAKFVADPLAPGKKMYRTGDFVRWLEDGNLEFRGRKDRQAKIRGYRIELSEIEAVLRGNPAVDSALVLARPHPVTREEQLVAYLTGKELPDPQVLRAFMNQYLPAYMAPSVIIPLEKFPLTQNGKIDTAMLPSSGSSLPVRHSVAPESRLEKMLVAIWEEVLGKKGIGINDNFFELGGHSILAARMVPLMNKVPGAALSIRDLFRCPTIEELSVVIREGAAGRKSDIIDLRKECQFRIGPDDLEGLPTHRHSPERILLTGATGFVGIYLLKELLVQTEAVIYCLVRAKDSSLAKQRIVDGLVQYGLYAASDEGRIVAITGELAEPRLGIGDQEYAMLSTSVDHIYHCGANMDLLSDYHRLKPANVGGTAELIRLATCGKLKKVIYISTLSVFANRPGIRYERDPIDGETHFAASGYAGSKWVGEKIVLNAMADGLPGQVIRLGLVTGDTTTGKMPPDQWFARLLQTCYRMGVFPQEFAVPAMPVDWTARSIVRLSLLGKEEPDIFHLCNPDKIPMERFFTTAEGLDGEISMTDSRDWLGRLYAMSASTVLPILPLLDPGAGGGPDNDERAAFSVNMDYRYSCEETMQFLGDEPSPFGSEGSFYKKYLMAVAPDKAKNLVK